MCLNLSLDWVTVVFEMYAWFVRFGDASCQRIDTVVVELMVCV